MYALKTHKRVDKFLEKHREIAKKVVLAFEEISKNPFQNTCDIKPLVNEKNHYRLRIGKYRFAYEIREKEILVYVYNADSRGGIYK